MSVPRLCNFTGRVPRITIVKWSVDFLVQRSGVAGDAVVVAVPKDRLSLS